jgi:hypothetical protein
MWTQNNNYSTLSIVIEIALFGYCHIDDHNSHVNIELSKRCVLNFILLDREFWTQERPVGIWTVVLFVVPSFNLAFAETRLTRSAYLGTAYLGLFPLIQYYTLYQPSTIQYASRTDS